MNKGRTWNIAFGGILAGIAIVIMCLGTIIPIATFVCPLICCLLCCIVMQLCGAKIAVAWYVAVAFLAVFMCPDKEAALVFIAFGYYPLIKQLLDKILLSFLFKVLYFNFSVLVLYSFGLRLVGMQELQFEYTQLGVLWLTVMLIAGNLTFILMDILMNRILVRR